MAPFDKGDLINRPQPCLNRKIAVGSMYPEKRS